MTNSSIYIHIPFCRSKCLYCDFYSGGERIADWDLYIDCILNELFQRRGELSNIPATLYLGGGTPSLIPAGSFKKLINGISDLLHVEKWKEFTIEVNPEDVDEEKCELWKECGVNRISIGIQSLNNIELKTIGRRHDRDKAVESIRTLIKHYGNISVDIMFGIPGQTLESYSETLREIIELSPCHISSYSLMLEKGTAMTHLVEKGIMNLPEEDIWMKMYVLTYETLKDAGYSHYEISNYSLPGFESIHNSSYWLGYPYLGLGPGAHSYDGKNIRKSNPADLKGYLGNFSRSHENIFYESEILSEDEMWEEMIMTRLRTCRGLDINEFKSRFGEKELESVLKKSFRFIKSNELKISGNYLKLSEKGILKSDFILSSII